MSSDGPLLDVRDLQVRIPLSRGTVRAVDGASFRVERGEALGLVGESGCGKSMTLRAILGLLPRPAVITGGQVLFEGEDLAAARPSRLRDLRGKAIAMIFQEPMTALNPVMKVGAQIAEAPTRTPRLRPPALPREGARADAASRHPRPPAPAQKRTPTSCRGGCASV